MKFSSVTILFLALTLIFLTFLVWNGATENFDHLWRQAALNIDPESAVNFWKGVTFFGSGLVISILTIAVILVLTLLKLWSDVRYIALVMVVAVIIENAMKWTLHRARPDLVVAYTMPPSFSFPSGHSLFATAFYGSLAFIVSPMLPSWARIVQLVIAPILIAAIGLSRIFLGVHYPTDVVAGFVAGVLCIAVAQQFNWQADVRNLQK